MYTVNSVGYAFQIGGMVALELPGKIIKKTKTLAKVFLQRP